MKKFLFIAITALALWSSCTKTPSVSVAGSIPEEGVSASGGTFKMTVTSDGEWRTSADDEGVVIEPSSGSGNQSVDIKVLANTSNDKKTITVTFYSVLGTSTQDVSILQQAPGIEVDLEKIENVSAVGGTYTVNVTSAGGWTSTSSSDYTLSPSSYTGSDKKEVTIAVSKNTSKDKREIKVTFYSSLNHDKTQTVTIQQNSSSIIVEPQKFEDVPASGGTVDVYVTSDGDWGTTPDDGIGVKPSSGNPGTKMKVSITVPANTSSGDIVRKVVFFSELNSEATQTVAIYQKAPSVSVKKMSDNVTAEGGIVEVNVTSDGGWKVKDPDVKGSYKVTPSEDSNSGTQSATITVYANTTKEDRDVKVKFCSALNDNVSETVSIPQEYINISVAPQKPGEVSVSGETINLTLISNGSWKTSVGKWTSGGQTLTTTDKVTLSPSSDSGSDSAQPVKATVPANSSGKERSVQVKFYSIHDSSISSTVTIRQKAPGISVKPQSTDSVSAAKGEVKVTVTSDADWCVRNVNGFTYGTPNPASGKSGSSSVTITVPENSAAEARDVKTEFYFVQNGNTVSDIVTFYQKAYSISVTPPEGSQNVHVAGDTLEVLVTSDKDWTVADWGDCTSGNNPFKSSGSSGESVKIKIPENSTDDVKVREVKFCLKGYPNVSKYVSFSQNGLSVSRRTAEVSASSNTVALEVTFYEDWRYDIGEWTYSSGETCSDENITVKSTSKTPKKVGNLKTQQVEIAVPENNSGKDRDVQIKFSSKDHLAACDAITIRQKAKE